jgi:hypothetical protein
LKYPPPQTLDWSIGIQHDIGAGFVLDVSYVGNVGHHQFNQGQIDLNGVPPLTDWTPTANNGQPGPVAKFLDPTSGSGGTAGFYSTNLIRALAGPYPGWGGIQMYTENGESHYEGLQAQFNKRVGRNFHFGSNYTWSKTLSYTRASGSRTSCSKTSRAEPGRMRRTSTSGIPFPTARGSGTMRLPGS